MSELEWGRVFDAHDTKCQHVLPKKEVSQCVWSCGRYVTEAQMKTLLDKYPDPMTRANFLAAMREPIDGEPKDKDVLVSLQAFDAKETNELTRLDVAQMLSTMNDKVTAAEVDALTAKLQFSADDRVSIDALFKHMTRTARSIRPSVAEIKKTITTGA